MEEQHAVAIKMLQLYGVHVMTSEHEPFALFKAVDVGRAAGLKNVHENTRHYPSQYKILTKMQTNGGPQSIAFLTFDGLRRLLCSCRSPKADELCKAVGIDLMRLRNTTFENDTIGFIMRAFEGVTPMIEQYPVMDFRVDLYFPRLKLALECDDPYHNSQAQRRKDVDRQGTIEAIEKCTFIYYRPHARDFDIAVLINRIMAHMLSAG